jgi:hypothetical protein
VRVRKQHQIDLRQLGNGKGRGDQAFAADDRVTDFKADPLEHHGVSEDCRAVEI